MTQGDAHAPAVGAAAAPRALEQHPPPPPPPTPPPAAPVGASDRRRLDRRSVSRVADLSLPELRRIVVTSLLGAAVLVLFLWMVRTVIIAAILGIVIAAYLRPLYEWMLRRVKRRNVAALLTLIIVIVPIVGALVYSYLELTKVIEYVTTHTGEISTRIDQAVDRFTVFEGPEASASIRSWVLRAANYGASLPNALAEALSGFAVAAAIFLFTAFYLFTDSEKVVAYVRAKIPPRYAELSAAFEVNVRGVLYGAIYATLLTQAIKTVIIFALNVVLQVPLAGPLAILSFIIGFFPIVGSWSVYLPVALWLLVFRQEPGSALVMVLVGGVLNTLIISNYLRPKLAATKSRVLNFYWMFVGLVTGVYTFGLAGILLGPILIGMLKAVVDTVTESTSWYTADAEGGPAPAAPDERIA
ncbi:MAG TPA: AI-2E family transporter [Gemmatimonadaceae bacterium]|nr:AI-2E family transporter [Gemmatimonadaceae bacterium]